MKVLKRVDWENSYKREVDCSQCRATLEIESKDIAYQEGEGDQREYSPEYLFVTCPECSQRLKLTDVPSYLQKLAKERSTKRNSFPGR